MENKAQSLVDPIEIGGNALPPVYPVKALRDIESGARKPIDYSFSDIGTGFQTPIYKTGEFTSQIPEGWEDLVLASNQFPNISAEDILEMKALSQNPLATILKTNPRAVVKFAEEVVKMPGYLYGLGKSAKNLIGWGVNAALSEMGQDNIFGEQPNSFSEILRPLTEGNDWIDGVTNIANKIYNSELLGVYKPKSVREGDIFDNLAHPSFWATEGADAAGYFASYLIPGVALKSLGVGAKLAKGLSRIKPMSNILAKIPNVVNKLDGLAAGTVNTVFESAAEAGGVYDAIKSGLIREGLDEYTANTIAADKAAKAFGANFGILLGPNIAMHNRLFGKVMPSGEFLKNTLGETIKEGVKKSWYKTGTGWGRVLSEIGKGGLREGLWEEGMQTATEDYFTRQGLNQQDESFMEDATNLLHNYAELLPSDTNMHKSIFLGALIGGLANGRGAAREYNMIQNFVYGNEGPKTRLGKTLADTRMGSLFFSKERKSVKQIIQEGLLTNYAAGLSDAIVIDEKTGKPKIDPETKGLVYDPDVIEKIGGDAGMFFTLQTLAHQALLNEKTKEGGSREAVVEDLLAVNDMSLMLPFLDSEIGIEYLKNFFIPEHGDVAIATANKYREKFYKDKNSLPKPEDIEAQKQQLLEKVDEYKKIYDSTTNRHSLEMLHIENQKKNPAEFSKFSQKILFNKLQANVQINQSERTKKKLQEKVNDILSKAPTKEVSMSSVRPGDVLDFGGVTGIYVEDTNKKDEKRNQLKNIKDVGKDKDLPIQSNLIYYQDKDKATKYEVSAQDNNELTDLYNNLYYAEQRQKTAQKKLDTLNNKNEITKGFEQYLKEVNKKENVKLKRKTFKHNTFYKNKSTGQIVKVEKLGDEYIIYEQDPNEEADDKFVIESSRNKEFLEDPKKFSEEYEETKNPEKVPTKSQDVIDNENKTEKKTEEAEQKESVTTSQKNKRPVTTKEKSDQENKKAKEKTEQTGKKKKSNIPPEKGSKSMETVLAEFESAEADKEAVRKAKTKGKWVNFRKLSPGQVVKFKEKKYVILAKKGENDKNNFSIYIAISEDSIGATTILSSFQFDKDFDYKNNKIAVTKLKNLGGVRGFTFGQVLIQFDTIKDDQIVPLTGKHPFLISPIPKVGSSPTTTTVKGVEQDDPLIGDDDNVTAGIEGVDESELYEEETEEMPEDESAAFGEEIPNLEDFKDIPGEVVDLGFETTSKTKSKTTPKTNKIRGGKKENAKKQTTPPAEVEPITNDATEADTSEYNEEEELSNNLGIESPRDRKKRHIDHIFETVQSNPREGIQQDYTGDLDALTWEFVTSEFALANGEYQLRIVPASEIYDDPSYLENNPNVTTTFEDTFFAVLVDKKGNFVTLSEDKTTLISDPNINLITEKKNPINRKIIFGSIRTSDLTYKSTNDTVYYTPNPVKNWEDYEALDTKGALKKLKSPAAKIKKAQALLKAHLKSKQKEFEATREKIKNALLEGKNVTIPIIGKSKGIQTGVLERSTVADVLLEEGITSNVYDHVDIHVALQGEYKIKIGNTTINTLPGHTYIYSKRTGNIYKVNPRKFTAEEAEIIIDLLQYHIQNKGDGKLITEGGDYLMINNKAISAIGLISTMLHSKYIQFNLTKGKETITVTVPSTTVPGSTKTQTLKLVTQGKLNPKVRELLSQVLPNLYWQVKNIKIKDPHSRIPVLTKVDLKGNFVEGANKLYKKHLVDDVLQMQKLTPKPAQEIPKAVYFGGGVTTYAPPKLESVYLIVDFNQMQEASPIQKSKGKTKKSTLNIKKPQIVEKGFEVKTLNKVPAAEKEKAPFKSRNSQGFIGFGKEGSSTKYYADQYAENGLPVNPETYIPGNTYFASQNGDGYNREQTLEEIIKALEAGAFVLLDNQSHGKGKYNKNGEGWLFDELQKRGYTVQETENKNTVRWSATPNFESFVNNFSENQFLNLDEEDLKNPAEEEFSAAPFSEGVYIQVRATIKKIKSKLSDTFLKQFKDDQELEETIAAIFKTLNAYRERFIRNLTIDERDQLETEVRTELSQTIIAAVDEVLTYELPNLFSNVPDFFTSKEIDSIIKTFEAPFRLIDRKSSEIYELEEFEKFSTWFKERFPQFGDDAVRISHELVQKGIFGLVADHAITLSSQAEIGTGYHEAFHMVTHYLIPENERQNLYREWKERNKNTRLTTYNGESKLGQEFTDKEVEEELAESFREYQLNGGKLELPPIQGGIFAKILNWIKNFFTPGIKKVFRNIQAGSYSNTPVRYNTEISHRGKRTFEINNSEMNHEAFHQEVMNATTVYYFDEIRKETGSFDIFFNKVDNSQLISDVYDRVKKTYEEELLDTENALSELKEIYERTKALTTEEAATAKNLTRKKEALKVIIDQMTGKNLIDFKESHADSLREFGLENFNKSVVIEDGVNESLVNVNTNENEITRDTAFDKTDNSVKFSAKGNASKSIKLLIGSLPELTYNSRTKEYEVKKNKYELPSVMKFGSMFNILLTKLSTTKTVPEVIHILSDLKNELPALNYFFTNNGLQLASINAGNLKGISKKKYNEVLQLVQTFAKTEENFSFDIINEGGLKATIDSSKDSKRRGIRTRWANSAQSKILRKDPHYVTDNGINYYDSDEFPETLDLSDQDSYLSFLASIGITFENFDNIEKNGDHTRVAQIANFIFNSIKLGDELQVDIFNSSESTNFYNNLLELIDIEYNANLDVNEMNHYGLDGDLIYNHVLNNYMSNIIDNLNKFNTWQEMVDFYPHLNTDKIAYLRNSWVLKKGGILFQENGEKRGDVNISRTIHEGIKEKVGETTKEFKKLSRADRFAAVFDRIMYGEFNILRTADKTLERFFSFPFSEDLDLTNKDEIFLGYLTDEILRIKYVQSHPDKPKWKNESENLMKGIMLEMLQKHHKSDIVYNKLMEFLNDPDKQNVKEILEHPNVRKFLFNAFHNYMASQRENYINWMLENQLITLSSEDTYSSLGITFPDNQKSMDVKVFHSFVNQFIFTDAIANIEQTKFLFGDPILFKDIADFFKRAGSFVGTKKLSITDITTDEFIEEKMKRTDEAEGLQDTLVGALMHNKERTKSRLKKIIRQIIFHDIKSVDEVFGDIKEETDGFSFISFDEYREMLFRAGDWTFGENSLEDLYQYEMQNYYGPKIGKKGFLTKTQFKKIFGTNWTGVAQVFDEELDTWREIKEKPNKKINMLKPLHVGAYAEEGSYIGLTKTAFGVIFPSMTINRPNLETMMHFMRKHQLGVVSFASANKGITSKLNADGEYNKLYDEDGNLNLNNITEETLLVQNTYYENWGIQLDTGFASHHDVVTGTQMMKQIMSYLYANGEVREEFADLAPAIKEYFELNAERLALGKEILLQELDLIPDGQNYKIKDLKKLKGRLKELANARNMSDNAYNSIDHIVEYSGADILINRVKFEHAIFGLNDALVIKQKMNGGSFYQHPAVLMEDTGLVSGGVRTYDKESGTLQSSPDLKMYTETDVDGKTVITRMQVILPAIFKGLDFNTIDKKLQDAIGFRIPTQGLANIEALEIVGYSDPSLGDVVIVPSALVKKSGSDFDIDTLKIYLPNYYYDEYNQPKYIGKETTYEQYVQQSERRLEKMLSGKLYHLFQKHPALKKVFYKTYTQGLQKFAQGYQQNEIIVALDEIIDAQGKDASAAQELKTILLTEIYKQGESLEKIMTQKEFRKRQIDNRLMAIHSEFILHPNNYANLVTPLDELSDKFKALANSVYQEVTGENRESSNYLDLLDRIKLVAAADRFLSSKDAVGITALYSPFHILAQISDLKIAAKDANGQPTTINLVHHSDAKSNIILGSTLNAKNEDISSLLRQWITEAVDAAKDPRMFDMNVTPETLNVALYLTMAGVPLEDLIYYLNQPIIREFFKRKGIWQSMVQRANKVTYYDKDTKIESSYPRRKSDKKIVKELIKEFGGVAEAARKDTLADLKKYIKSYRAKEYRKVNAQQVRILKDFIRYREMGNTLSSAIQGASWDTNSAGKSIAELLLRLNLANDALTTSVQDAESPVLINYDKLLEGSESFIMPYYKQNKALLQQFAPLFPVALKNPAIQGIIKFLATRVSTEMGATNEEKADVINGFITSAITYSLLNNPYSEILEVNKETFEEKRLANENTFTAELERLFTGEDSVAKRIDYYQSIVNRFIDFKNGDITKQELLQYYRDEDNVIDKELYNFHAKLLLKYENNDFFKGLIPNVSTTDSVYDHVVFYNKKRDTYEDAKLVNDWDAMINDEIEEMRELGLDLVKVAFMQTGLEPGPLSLISLIPAKLYSKSILNGLGQNSVNLVEAHTEAFRNFLTYSLQNYNNDLLVPNVTRVSKERAKEMSGLYPFKKGTRAIAEKYKDAKNKELLIKQGVYIWESLPILNIFYTEAKKFGYINDELTEDQIAYKNPYRGQELVRITVPEQILLSLSKLMGIVFENQQISNIFEELLDENANLSVSEVIQKGDLKYTNENEDNC